MSINKFNIMVYGRISKKKEVRVSFEVFQKTKLAKCPVGGLHFWEEPVDCLNRAAIEELNQESKLISISTQLKISFKQALLATAN